MNIAIAIFCYKREKSIKNCINSLKKNKEINEFDLIIYSDGSKNKLDEFNVLKVREYIKTIEGFRSIKIIYREKNLGLSESLMAGISELFKCYDSVIVIEDDLILSKYFLRFMKESLHKYKECMEVMCISGYTYPSLLSPSENFFLKGAECWGWATWRRSWNIFERDAVSLNQRLFEGNKQVEFNNSRNGGNLSLLRMESLALKIGSWAIRWHASVYLVGGLTFFPQKSVVNNLGFDEDGTNCRGINIYNVELAEKPIKLKNIEIAESKPMSFAIRYYFKIIELKNLCLKIKNYI